MCIIQATSFEDSIESILEQTIHNYTSKTYEMRRRLLIELRVYNLYRAN